MQDMSPVIVPRSDQINADSLQAGPITVKITDVKIAPGTEQPVTISIDGHKPWRPCKSMARVLVAAWGPDAKKYVGRCVTLFCDPAVKWGGMEVGGIRISHMSHIDRKMVLALTATKGNKKPFEVHPLKADVKSIAERDDFDPDDFALTVEGECALAEQSADTLKAWWDSADTMSSRKKLHAMDAGRAAGVKSMVEEKIAELASGEEV